MKKAFIVLQYFLSTTSICFISFCWMPNQWFSVSRLWAVGCMLWASPRWCAGVCAVLSTLTWTLASCMRRSSGPTHAWRLGTVMGLWPTVLQWRLDFNRLRLWWKKLSVLALDKKKFKKNSTNKRIRLFSVYFRVEQKNNMVFRITLCTQKFLYSFYPAPALA